MNTSSSRFLTFEHFAYGPEKRLRLSVVSHFCFERKITGCILSVVSGFIYVCKWQCDRRKGSSLLFAILSSAKYTTKREKDDAHVSLVNFG